MGSQEDQETQKLFTSHVKPGLCEGGGRILCTGHSLGGALATLCGIWAKTTWPFAHVKVVTAGSPRLGNAPFTQHYESIVDESWRIINAADVIPMLPLPPVPEYEPLRPRLPSLLTNATSHDAHLYPRRGFLT